MIEDRLTHAQRIRLEALSQSTNITTITSEKRPLFNDILQNAKLIEDFIKNAKEI
jgi:hypothetical protein